MTLKEKDRVTEVVALRLTPKDFRRLMEAARSYRMETAAMARWAVLSWLESGGDPQLSIEFTKENGNG